jgi:hypothetical protein
MESDGGERIDEYTQPKGCACKSDPDGGEIPMEVIALMRASMLHMHSRQASMLLTCMHTDVSCIA